MFFWCCVQVFPIKLSKPWLMLNHHCLLCCAWTFCTQHQSCARIYWVLDCDSDKKPSPLLMLFCLLFNHQCSIFWMMGLTRVPLTTKVEQLCTLLPAMAMTTLVSHLKMKFGCHLQALFLGGGLLIACLLACFQKGCTSLAAVPGFSLLHLSSL